jgi:hypothetical protein
LNHIIHNTHHFHFFNDLHLPSALAFRYFRFSFLIKKIFKNSHVINKQDKLNIIILIICSWKLREDFSCFLYNLFNSNCSIMTWIFFSIRNMKYFESIGMQCLTVEVSGNHCKNWVLRMVIKKINLEINFCYSLKSLIPFWYI